MMLEKIVTLKFKRPQKLSDPYSDFGSDNLNRFLKKNDEEPGWNDYSMLFGPHLPTGTYEEVMYFLPKAFTYLKNNEENALDLVTAIFGFCSKNLENLRKDNLEVFIKDKITDCLDHWVRDFRIEHFDKQMCKNKGWNSNYFDYVHNTETICEALTDLARFETLKCLAIEFVNPLAFHDGNIIKASWFLELSRARFDAYNPPDLSEIQNLLSDKKLLLEAYAVVWPEAEDYKLTYWRDTFAKLGL
jgi:hypothetical protein